MKTDELIALLATDAAPVPANASQRRFLAAVACGVLLALAWVQAAYGVRADLAHVASTAAFWQKLAMPLAISVCGAVVVFRLGHPGTRLKAWRWGLALPVALLWAGAAIVLWWAEPAVRVDLVMGRTWRVCVFNVMATAAPVGVALFWALKGLAPTRPVFTGAAAGWLAGALGASVYALHCPEMALPFIAVWYVLGMAASAALGAAAGHRWLRW